METKTTNEINCLRNQRDAEWVRVDELTKRLNSVMNVRNDEKAMRLLIIDIQLELSQSRNGFCKHNREVGDCYECEE